VDVEIWSDVVCPWCYIGKRRFEQALAGFEHRDEVRVTWRSFELDPQAPRSRSVDGATHLAEKYGKSREEAVAMQQRVADIAATDGLAFRHDIARGGNTFDAHRLLHLAAAYKLQDALKERLMAAYHAEGEPIGDVAVLERLSVEVGLPEGEVRDVLESDRYGDDVRDDERVASALAIGGVPFFVVDRAFAASGAQSPEVLGDLLREAWEAESRVSAEQLASQR
jgi:predicted DsbA family dithiol-disulfide isomerase